MTARRPQLEAEAFRRRQAIGAFRTGSDVDLERLRRRPNRPLYSGIAVAMVALTVAAGVGYTTGGPPKGWLRTGGVVIDKDFGGRYLVRDGVLRPVVNLTSLRLLTRGRPPDPIGVRHRDILTRRIGTPLGSPALPDSPPAITATGAGWVACADRAGRLAVLPDPAPVRAPAGGVLVRTGPRAPTYLVTGRAAYPLATISVIRALGYDLRQIRPVPASWLRLLPVGPALRLLPLPAGGPGFGGVPAGRVVTDRDTGQVYVSDRSTLRPVLDLTNTRLLSSPVAPLLLPHNRITTLPAGPAFGLPGIPASPPRVPAVGQPAVACVSAAGAPVAVLPQPPLRSGSAPTAILVPRRAGVTAYEVPGSAVLVRPPSPKTAPVSAKYPTYLVADGAAYPMTSSDALTDLGYADRTAAVLPLAWISLLPTGPVIRPLR